MSLNMSSISRSRLLCVVTIAMIGSVSALPVRAYVAVSSLFNNKVVIYDRSGHVTSTITASLNGPCGVAIAPRSSLVAGDLYVSNTFTNVVTHYSGTNFALIGSISGGGLDSPNGLAFGPDGNLYVTSGNTDDVKVFDASGNFVRSIGGGGLDVPMGLVFDRQGNLYVASSGVGSNEVKVYDPQGNFLRSIGGGGLTGPTGVVIGPSGTNIFVGSAVNDSVKVFSLAGVFERSITGGGMDAPWGVAFAPGDDDLLYVVSANSNDILRYFSNTGAFFDVFTTNEVGALDTPVFVAFSADVTPPQLINPALTGDGRFQFEFISVAGAPFTALSTTNVTVPLNQWTALGPVTETSPGHFRFTSVQPASGGRRFYAVRSP